MRTYRKLAEFVERIIATNFKSVNRSLRDTEKLTGIKKIYFIHAFLALTFAILLMSSSAANRYILVYLYPGYCTIKALKKMDEQQVNRWLKFWSVYGFLRTFEGAFDALIGFVPFYQVAKFVLIIWCYVPLKRNGSDFFYDRYLSPTLTAFQNHSLDDLGERALEQLSLTLKLRNNQTPTPTPSLSPTPTEGSQSTINNAESDLSVQDSPSSPITIASNANSDETPTSPITPLKS